MKHIASVLLLMMVPGCTAGRDPAAPAASAALTLDADIASVGAVHDTIEAGGVVRARTTATIASRIVASVSAVDVVPGDRVRAGRRLILLDAGDLTANVTRAAAAVSAATSATAAARSERDAADAALTLARSSHERISMLHAQRSATPHELDEVTAALRGAEARLAVASARIDEAAATQVAAAAARSAAAASASYAALTAPFDGVVTERLINPGDLASPGVPLLRLDDTRGFRVEVKIDESRVAGITTGQPVDIAIGARMGDEGSSRTANVAGHVVEISRAVDPASHTFLVKIDVPFAPTLRSGLFARARFDAGTRQAITVPRTAIVRQGQLSTLFVITARGRAQMRVVNAVEADRDRIEVLAGVAPGERIVVAPPPALRDGDAVQPAGASALDAGGR